MAEEPTVPLTMMLSSIDSNLREIRKEIASKAEVASLATVESRVSALERDSAADDAASDAVKSMSVSRKAIWLSIGLTVANWLVSVLMWAYLK